MKLPGPIVITREKLTEYLLVRRPRNDKSGYLRLAGYDAATRDVLERDLRELAESGDAEPERDSAFGHFFSVRGRLKGPNGKVLAVKTIWIELAEAGQTRFVTLVPDEE